MLYSLDDDELSSRAVEKNLIAPNFEILFNGLFSKILKKDKLKIHGINLTRMVFVYKSQGCSVVFF